MTPEQFCEAIDALGLTQDTAATLLGVHPRTTRRWANAEREIPGPVDNFLRYLVGARMKAANAIRVAPKARKTKGSVGPTFVCEFSDGQVTRMSTFTSLTKLDLERGLRLSRAAYEARARRFHRSLPPVPPPIVCARFEQDGKTLAAYDGGDCEGDGA